MGHVAKPARVRWEVRYAPPRGYMVVAPSGETRGPFASKDNADTCRDKLEARENAVRKRMVRPCLCCQRPFESEGIHNRMCGLCRLRDPDDVTPYGLAPRSGRPR